MCLLFDQTGFHITEWSERPAPFPATALLPGLDEPDWTEIELSRGIPTSGLYLQLTVIWMQLMVSSRSTKTELFWVWALSALDSEGVVLWRLTATAGPVCQILMWHTRLSYPQRENWERDWGGHHMTGGASMKCENILCVRPKSPHSLYEKIEALTGNSTFHSFLLH